MEFFVFGESGRSFGYYYPAEAPISDAVIIPTPLFDDGERTHWLVRQLARELAKQGVATLRVDLSGTGNSKVQFENVRISDWLADIRTAESKLLELTRLEKCSAIGIRFACGLLAHSLRPHRLICLDPIWIGRTYLDHVRNWADRVPISGLTTHALLEVNEYFAQTFSVEIIADLESFEANSANAECLQLVRSESIEWNSSEIEATHPHHTIRMIVDSFQC